MKKPNCMYKEGGVCRLIDQYCDGINEGCMIPELYQTPKKVLGTHYILEKYRRTNSSKLKSES